MNRFVVFACAMVLVGVGSQSASADTTSLQEIHFNLNGTQFENSYAVLGLDASAFDKTTGVGTLVETFNPGVAGSYNFDAFFDHELNLPFFNEFGFVSGAPAAGQTFQIDDPTFGNDWSNTVANTLDNTNHVPGAADNFAGACASVYDSGCEKSNDDVSLAMGFDFVLAADEEAVATLTVSHNQPRGGFYLQQTHQQDANNVAQLDLFLSGNIVIQPAGNPPPPSVPEPGTWSLLGTASVLTLIGFRHKFKPSSVKS